MQIMNFRIFLLLAPLLSVMCRPWPHLPASLESSLVSGRGSWRLLKTCVSERSYCTFTMEEEMVGKCVEAEEVCWNIGYGWVVDEDFVEENEVTSLNIGYEDIVEFPETVLQIIPDIKNPIKDEISVESNSGADISGMLEPGTMPVEFPEEIVPALVDYPNKIVSELDLKTLDLNLEDRAVDTNYSETITEGNVSNENLTTTEEEETKDVTNDEKLTKDIRVN